MLERAQELHPMLSHLRRTIHQNPELSFEEHKTAAFVSETLTKLRGVQGFLES